MDMGDSSLATTGGSSRAVEFSKNALESEK